jgi:ATP phosphoribosyltransferase regulatory subunit
MTDFANRALLPAGLRDILPPDASHEANVAERVMARFATHGYERVKTPLIEFEESLLDGSGAATSGQTFRVMDPLSQRMMGLRADITPQVARVATTRLSRSPRPLRLSYCGQVLRVKGTQLRPERQFGQAGIELIGSECASADAEVVLLAADALNHLGACGISVDLSLPTLVPALFAELGVAGADAEALREALDHKDAAGVASAHNGAAALLATLVRAVGPAERGIARLQALDLPPAAAFERDRLAKVVELVRAAAPDLTLTVDPVENRGFEYHTGVGFTLFARNIGGELGRGGRYLAGGDEPAVGASLFLDTVLLALPGPLPVRRVYVPAGTAWDRAEALRLEGWVTVAGLDLVADAVAEATRLGCGHRLAANGVIPTS